MRQELITFKVETERFGIDVMAVREIRAWTPGTRLPSVPHYVSGVVNLRGTVIPVIDLAARIGWKPTDASERHAIIVLELGNQLCGLIVHEVSDIVSISRDELQPPPLASESDIGNFLEGLVSVEEELVLVLATDALNEDISIVEAATDGVTAAAA